MEGLREKGLAELTKLKKLLEDKLNKLKVIVLRVNDIGVYNSSTSDEINKIKEDFLDIVGHGDYRSYHLTHCKKSELINKLIDYSTKAYAETLINFENYSTALNKIMEQENDPKRIAYRKIENGEAELVGESEWYKDSAYRVYQVDGKYYAIVVYDRMNHWLEESTIEEIAPSELDKYI